MALLLVEVRTVQLSSERGGRVNSALSCYVLTLAGCEGQSGEVADELGGGVGDLTGGREVG